MKRLLIFLSILLTVEHERELFIQFRCINQDTWCGKMKMIWQVAGELVNEQN